MAQQKDGVFTWMHSDHLHSATVLTDADGLDIRRLAYAAFGEEAANTGAGAAPTYTYTDKERDRSGLLYYGARYYDPALARFITADSVYDRGPQGLNRYSYALNNPILYRDPTGQYIDDGEGANCYRCVFGSPEKILDGTASIDDGRDGTFNQTVNSYLAGGYAAFPAAPGMYASSYSWRGNGLTSGDQFLRDLWHDVDSNKNDPHYATIFYADKAAEAAARGNVFAEIGYIGLASVSEVGPLAIDLLLIYRAAHRAATIQRTFVAAGGATFDNIPLELQAITEHCMTTRWGRIYKFIENLPSGVRQKMARMAFKTADVGYYVSGAGRVVYDGSRKFARIEAAAARAFRIPVHEVSPDQINAYLQGLSVVSRRISFWTTMTVGSARIARTDGIVTHDSLHAYINAGH